MFGFVFHTADRGRSAAGEPPAFQLFLGHPPWTALANGSEVVYRNKNGTGTTPQSDFAYSSFPPNIIPAENFYQNGADAVGTYVGP